MCQPASCKSILAKTPTPLLNASNKDGRQPSASSQGILAMRRSKGQEQSDKPSNPVDITWKTTPPTPAQRAAWEKLWVRLLGPALVTPDTRQPQQHEENAGAELSACMTSAHHHPEDIVNDTTTPPCPPV